MESEGGTLDRRSTALARKPAEPSSALTRSYAQAPCHAPGMQTKTGFLCDIFSEALVRCVKVVLVSLLGLGVSWQVVCVLLTKLVATC